MKVIFEPLPQVLPPGQKEMLSVVSLPTGKLQVRINFSSLSILQECSRKAEYSLIRKLRGPESAATIFGSAIHKALEVYYSGSRTERVPPSGYEDVMDMIGAGHWEPSFEENLLFRSARAFVNKCEAIQGLPPENKRSVRTGVWILKHYFQKYVADPFVIYSDAEGPIVERSFSMPIYEDDNLVIQGFGTIDFVLRNEETGDILPGDHKTTSQLGTPFYQRLNPNFQYTFYSWAAREVLGLQTENFLVNAIQVKEVPKTARGSAPQFARQVTTRRESDIEELKYALIAAVGVHMAERKNNFFPMSAPGPCSNYGGCQYLDICASPKELRETVIKARFHG